MRGFVPKPKCIELIKLPRNQRDISLERDLITFFWGRQDWHRILQYKTSKQWNCDNSDKAPILLYQYFSSWPLFLKNSQSAWQKLTVENLQENIKMS